MKSGSKISIIALRYAFAVVVVAIAALVQRRLGDSFGPMPLFIMFYPAILLVASICGGGPGIVATLLAALAADYWFVQPTGSLRVETTKDVLSLGIFTVANLFLCLLAERLRRARWAEALSVAQQQRAEELGRQNEELAQQSEELSRQGEELSQQTEELSGQNEELQVQSEEILALNDELHRREALVQAIMDAERAALGEHAALRQICGAVRQMFGEAATAVMVYEEQGKKLVVRASSGLGDADAVPESLPTEHSFAELVIQQNRTAALNDVALRPDLSILNIPTLGPFQAELCAPMQQAGRAFGAVAIYSAKPQEWSAEQFRLAEWLAGHCAQALDALRLQHALQESEERFRTLADAISQLAWIARPDGWIYWYNQRWYEYTGTTPEQMEGWGWQSVHDPQTLPAVLERWKGSIKTSEPFSMIFPLRGADGVFRPFLTRVMPLKDKQGQVLQWFGTCTDISEQKATEADLAAAKKSAENAKAIAEQANRAKDHFLAVLSHELRTPLAPVVLGVSMLQDRSDLVPPVRETLEMIGRNVEMEARLIDDLLDVSRIAQGKVELQKQRVELCTVIQQAIDVCKADIEARQLEFGLDMGSAAPYWVEADVSRLQQVFWNLLKNAIKFTPKGGCMGIRCRPNESHVVVEVNDSGIGIEPEALTRVFNAFEQAERSITRQFGGLGLGLAISKALVEMHGGTIEAHSEGRNKGATFRIELPLVAPAGERKTRGVATARQRPARPLRILLVEDHGATAKMMRMVLTADGHSVEPAGDVATALELASRSDFDLLMSDLGLPDGSGHDLMRQLRERGHTFPGIALSGYGQEDDIRRSREAGFVAHLTKPASREALVEAIAAVTAAKS